MSKCSVYECENAVHAKKLCSMHYKRLRKHGDVNINYAAKYIHRKIQRKKQNIEMKELNLSFDEMQFLRENFKERLNEYSCSNEFDYEAITCNHAIFNYITDNQGECTYWNEINKVKGRENETRL